MHDALAFLVVLFFGDPNGLELRHLREDRAAKPAGVLAVCGRLHLRLHGRRSQRLDFLRHSRLDSLEHRAAPRKHYVSEQVLLNVWVTFHYRVVCEFVDSVFAFHVGLEIWSKQKLRASQSFLSYFDRASTWQ